MSMWGTRAEDDAKKPGGGPNKPPASTPIPQPFVVTLNLPDAVLAQLNRIETKLDALSKQEATMDQALQDALTQLAADVTANTDGIGSAETLLAGLAAKVDALAAQLAAGVDPAAVASQLQAFSASL